MIDIKELDSRNSDGIHVTLLYDSASELVWIELADTTKNPTTIESYLVPNDRALDAFNHPFAYINREVCVNV